MSMFWPGQVDVLVNALALHEKTVSINTTYLKNALYSHQEYQSPKGDFAYCPISTEHVKSLYEGNNSLSVDGILHNRVVETIFLQSQKSGLFIPFYSQPEVSQEKKTIWNKIFPKSVPPKPVYSVDDVLKGLYDEKLISILMSHPPAPHTLLCRLTCVTYDIQGITVQTRPVLVKPGISPDDEQIVYQWENNNIKTERRER